MRARTHNAATPFALVHTAKNAQQIYCLNKSAEQQGLGQGMSLSDARALCPDLHTALADPQADIQFLATLARWAKRYCPWVGFEENGLVLDVTGSTHLFATQGEGGEDAMMADMCARLNRAGMSVSLGCADTRGAAWALARFAKDKRYKNAPEGKMLPRVGPLPVAALRIDPETDTGLQRLGLRTITQTIACPRATLSRRFGKGLLLRLDQLLGTQPEPVSPSGESLRFAARLTLPEPIGLIDDVSAALARLLTRTCAKLAAHEKGARQLRLRIRRVDMASHEIEVNLARPMRDSTRIAALFEKPLSEIDAGYGIDQLHLIVTQIEDLSLRQISRITSLAQTKDEDGFTDLITRLGNRVGFDNVTRVLPAQSHIPEKSYLIAPAAYSEPSSQSWFTPGPRPLILFAPEIIMATGPQPPDHFRWRAQHFTTAQTIGPERIAPEWWLDDPNWRSGLRDYWRIQTRQGRRLWLFFTPQQPGWFIQGEFA